jgi:hypothetical protein
MPKEELLDLLREARVSVFHDHEYASIFRTKIEPAVAAVPKLADLLARIDAALAERQDSAKDVVEWDEGENYEGKHWWDTTIGDRAVHVEAWDKGGTRFYWRVFSTLDEEGHQPTLAEAKSASIAAAKGIR